jgi:hypothetical protein
VQVREPRAAGCGFSFLHRQFNNQPLHDKAIVGPFAPQVSIGLKKAG